MESMKSNPERLNRIAPSIIAILVIIVCFVLLLCGKNGAFKNILLTLVGYYFGQASRNNGSR
jgi:hypothetical protein